MQQSALLKANEVQEEAQHIGNYLDWLIDVKKIRLHQTFPGTEEIPVILDTEDLEGLMLEYFGIDRAQLEAEQREKIAAFRDIALKAQETAGDYIKIVGQEKVNGVS